MKRIKFIVLFLALSTIEEFNYCDEKDKNSNAAAAANTAKTATQWSTAAKVAAGVAGTAAVAGAVYLYDPTILTNLAEQTSDLINWLGGTESKKNESALQSESTSQEPFNNPLHSGNSQVEQNAQPTQEEDLSIKTLHLEPEAQNPQENEHPKNTQLAPIQTQQIATEKEAAHRAEFAQIEAQRLEQDHLAEIARIELQAKLTAEEKAKIELEQRNNLLMNIGIAAGTAGVIGLGIMSEKTHAAEQKVAQLKKDNDKLVAQLKTKPLARSQEQFEYLNYLDIDNNLTLEDAQATSFVHNAQQERKNKAAELKNLRTDAARNASIPEIETQHVNLVCGNDGYPTLDAIKELMHKQYFTSIDSNTLTVSLVNIGNNNGNSSQIIYCVSIKNNPIFFLKISNLNKADAKMRLESIQKGRIGRIGIEARYADTKLKIPKEKLPVLTWVEKFFIYKNSRGQDAIIEVTHAAHGKSLNSILASENDKLQLQAMQSIGNALGNFQQAFMDYNNSDDAQQWTTVSHGDLNGGNIFFDATKQKVYFIDNETMEDNFNISVDVYCIVYITLLLDTAQHNQINNMVTFIKSYIETFPPAKRKSLEKCLIELELTYRNVFQQRFPSIPYRSISSQFIEALNNKVFKHYIAFIHSITGNLTMLEKVTKNSDGTRTERTLNKDNTITRTIFNNQNEKTQEVILKNLKPINAKFFYPDGKLQLNAVINNDGSENHTYYDTDGTTIKYFIDIDSPTLPQKQTTYVPLLGKRVKTKEIITTADKSGIIKDFDTSTGQLIATRNFNSQGQIIP